MEGIALQSLNAGLTRVPAHMNRKPVRSFNAMGLLGEKFRAYALDLYETDDIEELIHELPEQAFQRFDTDQAAKAMLSAKNSIPMDVERALEKNPVLKVVRKVDSSMWRWGYDRGSWNDIVSAVEGLAAFNLESEGFEIALDWTTGRNECGFSEHTRTFLDGVFGFLVHWKGEHVMTIGFSFAKGRRLLIQQVQNTKPTGNRWLFKLPKNRIEHVIKCFMKAFPKHRIHIADGADYANRSLDSYQAGQNHALEFMGRAKRSNDLEEYEERKEHAERLGEKIAHLKSEIERLASLYRDTGRYERGRTWKTNGLKHYAIAA